MTENQSGRHEILVGMCVSDEAAYQRYRDEMVPILEAMGGYFRYDMRMSELLKGEAEDPFNRVFILSFPDEQTKERFFGDSTYKRIKEQYFVGAVKSYRELASFTN